MEGGQFRVRLQVQQEGVPDDFLAYVPVTVDLGKDRVARVRVKVTGARSDLELPPDAGRAQGRQVQRFRRGARRREVGELAQLTATR